MKMQPLMEPSRNRPALYSHEIATPVGPMLAVSSEDALYLLDFFTRRNLDAELANLRRNAEIISGRTSVSRGLERELADYFAGRSATFETPLKISGSDFQRSVWTQLRTIAAGDTWSYADLANAVGQPTAARAVAGANAANQFAIVVPCHRVIASSGALGGYAGGVQRKQWLLEHERRHWRGADRLL